MTEPSTKPLAEWTVPEKCNYLAKEIMGWPGGYKQDHYGFWGALKTPKTYHQWEPYRSWDNGREVEEKVMEDEKLIHLYWDAVMKSCIGTCPIPRLVFIFADLPTRVNSLIIAFGHLHSKAK